MGGRGALVAGVVAWAGLLLGAGLPVASAWGALLLGAVCGGLAWRSPPRTGAAAALLALLLAAAARGAGHQAVLARQRAQLAQGGAFFRVEARVAEPPPREGGEPLAILTVARARPALAAGTRLRVRLPAGSEAEWGDVVDAAVRLERPGGLRNPGGFDLRAAADAAALAASGRAFFARVRPGPAPGDWPRLTVARWRRAVEGSLDRGLSPAARELIVPLVIGDRSGLSTSLYADLRASGLIHLIALSGLHVVWLASIARAVVASLGGGVAPRALASALCALLYTGLAGPLPSLVRAAAQEGLRATATLRGRSLDPLQGLALGALGLLACAPGWATDLGFQLSCATTLGLVTLGPWLVERAGRRRAWCAAFVPTLSAQTAALPLLLARFHAVSWVGSLANLVAVPLSGFLLAAAWLGAIADLALPGTGHPWFSAAEVLAAALERTTAAAARVPGALAAAGAEPGVAACATAGVLLLVVALAPPRTLEARRRPDPPARAAAQVAGGVLLGVALLCVLTARPLAPPPGAAWLVALDVGQGDAFAFAAGDDWWLLDAGPRSRGYDAGEGIVLPFFRWAGVRRLQWLVITHDDADHAGGSEAVRRGLTVLRLGAPPSCAAGRRARPLARGDRLDSAPPARVLWPPREERGGGDNAGSLVLEVGGGQRLLFLADVDSTVEESLAVESGVAVLKLAHHGAASSSGARFLQRLRPRIGLLSVGAWNRFGHPAPEVLARLAAAGVEVRRTDLEGAIWLEWSASGIHEVAWRHGEPRPATAPAVPRFVPHLPRRP
jgi:competence protein ComEC